MQLKTLFIPIRFEKIMPLALFALFLVVSTPGVTWGAPALWNPDELVWRVLKALNGELQFDENEPDYNYPSLPKYVMYGTGKLIYGLGFTDREVIIAARLVSVLLGGLSIVLIYSIARMISGNLKISALAGLLGIAAGVISANARFAHNDIYLLFFTTLCIYLLLKYQYTGNRLWLYGSFFSAGLAGSSKYTGISLILIPLFTLMIINWDNARKDLLRTMEWSFMGGIFAFLGYATGTPKALLWMAFYFKRAIPAMQNFAIYGLQPDSVPGIWGQWAVFRSAVGPFVYYLFLASFVWMTLKLVLSFRGRISLEEERRRAIFILIVTVLFFDLPYLASVNYIPRHFIPFVPFLSVLAALAVADLKNLISRRKSRRLNAGLTLAFGVGIVYSFLRLVSMTLLFVNDARILASEFIATLPGENKTIEYTLYPPRIEREQFDKARNYPIFFVKYPGQDVPIDKAFEYNQGEAGLIERKVDYLVTDTFTYNRFSDQYVCAANPVECEFFAKLLAGKTSYKMIGEFTYSLPPYLPQVTVFAVNPEIRIYKYSP